MIKTDFTTINKIKKSIKNSKKRKTGEMTDSYYFKIMIAWLICIIPTGIELFIIDNVIIATFFPIVTLLGAVGISLNEVRVYFRDVKTEKNLNNAVNELENKVNIKTNINNLSNSVILEDVEFTNEVRNDKLISNNCYVFKDDLGNLQGLLEDDSKKNPEYYILEQNEVQKLVENSPKVRKLIR